MISHIILRKKVVWQDLKTMELKGKTNGRRVLVNEIRTETEKPIESPEWECPALGHRIPVLETGYGGIEIGTFTEKAQQDCHKHLICTEIYTVIEGSMTIKMGKKDEVVLTSGDEIIVLPGTVHEVVPKGTTFLTRVHAINCYGTRDKYIEQNGVWCQELTLENQKHVTK